MWFHLSHKLCSRIASLIAFASDVVSEKLHDHGRRDPADRAREQKPERAGGTMYDK